MGNKYIVLITGFPGSGKLTTAQTLANQHQFKLIANYYINKSVLELIDKDQNALPPEKAWEKIEIIWNAVFETIRELSPDHFNFVITRPLIHGMEYSENFYNNVHNLAKEKKNILVPIRLVCDEQELIKRIQSEKRNQLGKVTDPNRAKFLIHHHKVFQSNHPNEITINNTHQSHEETVRLIMSHIKNCG